MAAAELRHLNYRTILALSFKHVILASFASTLESQCVSFESLRSTMSQILINYITIPECLTFWYHR